MTENKPAGDTLAHAVADKNECIDEEADQEQRALIRTLLGQCEPVVAILVLRPRGSHQPAEPEWDMPDEWTEAEYHEWLEQQDQQEQGGPE